VATLILSAAKPANAKSHYGKPKKDKPKKK
jgi:hypothetical protein